MDKTNKAVKKQNQTRGRSEFHESTSMVLLLFKCVGLLPIAMTRVNTKFTSGLWSLISGMPYMILMILHVLFLSAQAYSYLVADYNIKRLFTFFFDLISFLEMFLLLLFTKTYGKFMRKVESIENSLPPLRRPGRVTKVSLRITALVTLLTLVQFILDTLFNAHVAQECFALSGGSFIKSYFEHVYAWSFRFIPFNYVTAVLLKICRLQMKLTWHLVDTLVFIVSYSLAVRLQDFNRIMCKLQKQTIQHRLPWPELQVHYTRLMRLVNIVDTNISCFVLASFTMNICYIGKLAFVILNEEYTYDFLKDGDCGMVIQSNDYVKIINIVYSMTYLVVRTVCVASVAACIHTQSRKPLNALYTVPASSYNRQLQSFMDQVYHSKVGLSGLGLFYISREMILTVIATLTTYELVLLQF